MNRRIPQWVAVLAICLLLGILAAAVTWGGQQTVKAKNAADRATTAAGRLEGAVNRLETAVSGVESVVAQAKQSADSARAQSSANGDILARLEPLAKNAAAAAADSKRSIDFLTSPERQQVVIDALTQIKQLFEGSRFQVVDPEKPNKTPLIVTPIPSPSCHPTIGLGNQGVVPGILQTCPQP